MAGAAWAGAAGRAPRASTTGRAVAPPGVLAPPVAPDPGQPDPLVHHPEPAVQADGVAVTQPAVLDPGDDPGRRVQGRQPALVGVQVVLGQLAADGELEHRQPLRDEVADGLLTLLQPQIARVQAVSLHGDE